MLFSHVFDLYKSNPTQKITELAVSMFKLIESDENSNENRSENGHSKSLKNNSFHKLLYFIGFIEMSDSKRIKIFISQLAFMCLNGIIQNTMTTNGCKIQPHRLTNESSSALVRCFHFHHLFIHFIQDVFIIKITLLVEKIKLNCYNLFIENSYSMYNLIKFLDLFIVEHILENEKLELQIVS
jgi:hypothetical protein